MIRQKIAAKLSICDVFPSTRESVKSQKKRFESERNFINPPLTRDSIRIVGKIRINWAVFTDDFQLAAAILKPIILNLSLVLSF